MQVSSSTVHRALPPPIQSVSPSLPGLQVRTAAKSAAGTGDATDILEVMTSQGAPLEGLLDSPEQVLVTPTSQDTLNITWAIPEVC